MERKDSTIVSIDPIQVFVLRKAFEEPEVFSLNDDQRKLCEAYLRPPYARDEEGFLLCRVPVDQAENFQTMLRDVIERTVTGWGMEFLTEFKRILNDKLSPLGYTVKIEGESIVISPSLGQQIKELLHRADNPLQLMPLSMEFFKKMVISSEDVRLSASDFADVVWTGNKERAKKFNDHPLAFSIHDITQYLDVLTNALHRLATKPLEAQKQPEPKPRAEAPRPRPKQDPGQLAHLQGAVQRSPALQLFGAPQAQGQPQPVPRPKKQPVAHQPRAVAPMPPAPQVEIKQHNPGIFTKVGDFLFEETKIYFDPAKGLVIKLSDEKLHDKLKTFLGEESLTSPEKIPGLQPKGCRQCPIELGPRMLGIPASQKSTRKPSGQSVTQTDFYFGSDAQRDNIFEVFKSLLKDISSDPTFPTLHLKGEVGHSEAKPIKLKSKDISDAIDKKLAAKLGPQ